MVLVLSQFDFIKYVTNFLGLQKKNSYYSFIHECHVSDMKKMSNLNFAFF